MARTPIWSAIRISLTQDIAAGRYGSGDKLPTEAALAARFGVNRHTVRQALSAMADEGLVHARRGSGVFVAATPTDYPIGRRTRFTQNLTAAGRVPAITVLTLETRSADARERTVLGLNPAPEEPADVHVYEGLSLADNQPIALFRSVFPAARFPGFLDSLRDTQSVTAALSRHGIADYTRAETRLTAKAASATQALHLRIPEQAPILRSVAINVDPEGRPIEYGHSWFSGDRVTLIVTPQDMAS
ncbi:phosphonate metabolism transcriptional regulator PhnF [Pseudoruegeria sp. SK021]|uniref:phosphonate metabolism transcriptional regulator PhnF n=1 Tax=Pseudoruegeria sp. SK021 TaxID=1933035 RepID=UPI000A2597C4|nr:phosphonate metabolism transcriptional regulator PhnF [Pseudoruegeria sp. SK021]OSP55936.1 phosphonate metabolism transcriptional regulator PhnF [Pseudoruegeria sp. SK021]